MTCRWLQFLLMTCFLENITLGFSYHPIPVYGLLGVSLKTSISTTKKAFRLSVPPAIRQILLENNQQKIEAAIKQIPNKKYLETVQGSHVERVQHIAPYLAIAALAAYKPKTFGEFSLEETYEEDGFLAAVFINQQTKQILVSYRGSKNLSDLSYILHFFVSDLSPAIYAKPIAEIVLNPRVKRVRKLHDSLERKYPAQQGWKTYVTGHSLGGVYSTMAAMIYGYDGATYNSPGLSWAFYLCPDFAKCSGKQPARPESDLKLRKGQVFKNRNILGDVVYLYPWGKALGESETYFVGPLAPPVWAHSMKHFLTPKHLLDNHPKI